MRKSRLQIIRKLAVEMAVYGALVVGYFSFVLQYLGDPLKALFASNLSLYAFVAVALIMIQGVVLEIITSFIVGLLGLGELP